MPDEVTTFSIDWFSDDGAIARRALAGEPILILPSAPFYDHWGILRHVGEDGVAQFVDNWRNRMTRGIRRQNVAIKQEHEGPAVGWYTSIEPGDGGVAARMAFNRKGRRLLEEGGYAYFSPEIAWRMRDRVTNDFIDNQVTGGGLTNDPYLGEVTALMSRRGPLCYSKGGLIMPPETSTPPQDEASVLGRFFAGLASQLGRGSPAPTGDTPGAAPAAGGTAGGDVAALTQEVAQLRTDLENAVGSISTLTQQRDTALEQVQSLTGRVSDVERARDLAQFRAMAASDFSHLPGSLDQIASELYWLHGLDTPSGDNGLRPHFEFFRQVMRQADETLASAFKAQGSSVPTPGSVLEQVNGLISKYRADNPESSHEDAMSAVFASNPALYGQYMLEIDSQAREGV